MQCDSVQCSVQQLSTILMSTFCVWCTVVHNQGNSCKALFLHSVLQCGGVFRQEADPHPSIQPFPILAAAQRGNFKRHVHNVNIVQAIDRLSMLARVVGDEEDMRKRQVGKQ